MVETSQLQTLVAVAKARSFSKAAEELHVTQSAISQSVKNLEKKLGVSLFRRSGKKVVLTGEGEKLYLLANDFLGNLDDTLEDIQNDKGAMSGKIKVGTLNGVGKSWLAPELMDHVSKNQDLKISIKLGFQEDLVRDFENFRLDILILPEDCLPNIGEKVFLSEERSTLVFSKAFEGQINTSINLKELSEFPTILFEDNDPLYLNWCRNRFKAIPKKINSRYVVNAHGNMLQAVASGLGVAVVPTHVLNRSHLKSEVTTLGTEFEVLNGKFYLVYHKESKELVRIEKTIERLMKSDNSLSKGI